jgi:hypothetical protein
MLDDAHPNVGEGAAPNGADPGPTPAANDGTKPTSGAKCPASTVPELKVGDPDERGNTVKYVYAVDPDYIVYYSRLEHRREEPNQGLGRRWRTRIGFLLGLNGPAYEREGVQALLSSDPAKRQNQLRKLLPLGTDRAKLRALLSGWPRRESYDSSIATALQLALDGDGDGKSPENALATLNDAKAAIAGEREIAGRGQWVAFALSFGILGFVILGIAGHNLFQHTGNFWMGTQAGLLGAIFSIAIGISNRTVAPNTNVRSNMTDSVLRLVIGAISGGTIVLFFSTGLLPALHTYSGDLDGAKSLSFVLLLGIIAGFVERLVPGLIENEERQLGGAGAATSGQTNVKAGTPNPTQHAT